MYTGGTHMHTQIGEGGRGGCTAQPCALSEFCCDGKAAGGPLFCLYSIQVEPGCLFHSSGTHANIYVCMWEKKEREWLQE